MANSKSIYEEFECFGKIIRVVMYADKTYEEFLNENGALTPISFLKWAIDQKKKQ